MNHLTKLADRYDTALSLARHTNLPDDYVIPKPTQFWPAENLALLGEYQTWLLSGGASPHTVDLIYMPMAGHILGLNLKPHPKLNLETDLSPAMAYILAKQMSRHWTKVCRNAKDKFARFMRQKRGYPEISLDVPDQQYFYDLYCQGLPEWLVGNLTRYQRLKQSRWRGSRLAYSLRAFWKSHTKIWHWLFARYPIKQPRDLKRSYILAYIDTRLAADEAVTTINHDILRFQATLMVLQEDEYVVPQALLRRLSLQKPHRFPRFLPDDHILRLKQALEQQVQAATEPHLRRDALLNRATFYLLWQGGLRIGEVEELRLPDLDLSQRRMTIRQGKGLQDRTVYLTERAVEGLQTYLDVRGVGPTDHVFLYRNRALRKDIVRDRLKAIGQTVGLNVTPHQLRHTCATQLLNCGCRVTSIQRLLGHRRLNSTMVYAAIHDHTVAKDYYEAMAQIEQQLAPEEGDDPSLPTLLAQLKAGPLTPTQQEALQALQARISSLAQASPGTSPIQEVFSLVTQPMTNSEGGDG